MHTRASTRHRVNPRPNLVPATAQDHACRNQDGASDCVVACFGMLTGLSNETIASQIFPEVDFNETGLSFPQIVAGCTKIGLHPVDESDFMAGVPALIVVPGLNRKGALHCLFWDGYTLCDPQTGKDDLKYYTFNARTRKINPSADIVKCWNLYTNVAEQ